MIQRWLYFNYMLYNNNTTNIEKEYIQQIRILKIFAFDTEDWSNDTEKSALQHENGNGYLNCNST